METVKKYNTTQQILLFDYFDYVTESLLVETTGLSAALL